MDAKDLGRWTRFAAKGGIGRCTAVHDCVAMGNDDLMFLAGDQITVLMQLQDDDLYLGFCEDIVGRFRGRDVHFHGKLKRPVIQKRSSTSTASFNSASPVPSPGLPKPEVEIPLEQVVSGTGRLSLPPPRKSIRSPTFPDDSSNTIIVTTTPPPSKPASPDPSQSQNASSKSKRRTGLADVRSLALPRGATFTIEDFAKFAESREVPIPSTSASAAAPNVILKQQPDAILDIPSIPSSSAPPTQTTIVREPTPPPQPFSAPPSTLTHDISLTSNPDDSFISVPTFDEDGETGIGLRLLAGLDTSDEDEDDEVPLTTQTLIAPPKDSTSSLSPPSPQPSKPFRGSLATTAGRLSPSTQSSRSAYSESDRETEWDGGEGIYDNYRYSRYSFKSARMSTFKSGAPPLPTEEDFENNSNRRTSSHHTRRSTATIASITIPESNRPSTDPAETTLDFPMPPVITEPLNIKKTRQFVPPPLNIHPPRESEASSSSSSKQFLNPGPSPLLHTTFTSPATSAHSSYIQPSSDPTALGSPTSPNSRMHAPLLSPRLLDEVRTGQRSTDPLQSGGGIASAIRAQLEAQKQILEELDAAESRQSTFHDESVIFDGHRLPIDEDGADADSDDDDDAEMTVEGEVEGNNPDSGATMFAEDASMTSTGTDQSDGEREQFEEGDEDEDDTQTNILDASIISSDPTLEDRSFSVEDEIEDEEMRSEETTNAEVSVAASSQPEVEVEEPPSTSTSTSTSASTDPVPDLPPSPSAFPPETPTTSPLPKLTPPPFSGKTDPSPFLPHPFAPKPPPIDPTTRHSRGPSIHRLGLGSPTALSPVNSIPSPITPPPEQSLPTVMHQVAMSYRIPPPADPSKPRPPPATIHGRIMQDLTTAMGPVPVAWLVDGWREREIDQPKPRDPSPGPAKGNLADVRGKAGDRKTLAPISAVHMRAPSPPLPTIGRPIERPGFTPTVNTPRPRSRSFSGFDAQAFAKGGGAETTSHSSDEIVHRPAARSSTVSARSSTSSRHGQGPVAAAGRPIRSQTLGPSPLGAAAVISSEMPPTLPSAPALRSDLATRSASSSPGPSLHHSSPSTVPNSPTASMGPPPIIPKRSTLRQAASTSGLRAAASIGEGRPERSPGSFDEPSPSPSAQSINRPESSQSRVSEGRPSPKLSMATAGGGTSPMPPARRASTKSQGQIEYEKLERFNSIETTRSTELSHHSESVTQHPPPSSVAGHASPTSPTGRTPSLRSRLSFSHLRGKSTRSLREASEPSYSVPPTPVGQHEFEEETVQVKDMEFELVKPVFRHREMRNSEESSPEKDAMSLGGDLKPDVDSARSLSPAVSARSPDVRSPAASSVDSFGTGRARRGTVDATTAAEATKEAHRARELKWMSTLSTMPSSQAPKSKKIRKLLQDPVPDSVRYLVWAHVLDAKSRRTDNIYQQMVKKGNVMIAEQVSADVEKCFAQYAHLRDPKGPVYSLVTAYAAMVPDVKYGMGLTVIAGHLLLQSPEEDAFWILMALMDSHTRPYYSPTGIQLESDASMFIKLLESQDRALAMRLFVDLGIRPAEICRVWFPYLFAGTLPSAHLHRVWDLFFFEGPVFLFRVGLALLQHTRRIIFDPSHAQPQVILGHLLRPSPETFPPPQVFIEQALAFRLKDDDLRKQRLKSESTLRTISSRPSFQSAKSRK